MDLYEITDVYIKYLQQFDKRVLSNHFVKHNRKYLGLGIELSGHMYYIPLSSPDSMDFTHYELSDGKFNTSVYLH